MIFLPQRLAGLFAQSPFSDTLQGNRPGFGRSVQLLIRLIEGLQHDYLLAGSFSAQMFYDFQNIAVALPGIGHRIHQGTDEKYTHAAFFGVIEIR